MIISFTDIQIIYYCVLLYENRCKGEMILKIVRHIVYNTHPAEGWTSIVRHIMYNTHPAEGWTAIARGVPSWDISFL